MLKEEYVRRQRRAGKHEVHQTSLSQQTLKSRIKDAERCGQCGYRNHKTDECKYLGQNRCGTCNRFGHRTEDCFSKKAKALRRKGKFGDNKNDKKDKKKQKKEEMNQREEENDDDDEHITFSVNEPSELTFDDSEQGQFFNFDESDVYSSSEYDSRLLYYDWLGDSATTSHVCNRCEAFKTFHPLIGTTISGVGNVKAKAKGRGTVELLSTYDCHDYILKLENVLYIPTNRNNLISLGRWDKAGGRYIGGGGALTLITKDGTSVARGTKIENNIYKMKVATRELNAMFPEAIGCFKHGKLEANSGHNSSLNSIKYLNFNSPTSQLGNFLKLRLKLR